MRELGTESISCELEKKCFADSKSFCFPFLLLLRDCMKLRQFFFFLFVFAAWTSTNELHQYRIDSLNLRWSHPHQSERRRNSQSCNLDHRSLSWRGWNAKAYFADLLEELLVHPGVYWKPYWPVQLPLGRTHRLLALHQLSPLHLAPYVCLSAPKRTLFNPRAWCMMGGNWFRGGGGCRHLQSCERSGKMSINVWAVRNCQKDESGQLPQCNDGYGLLRSSCQGLSGLQGGNWFCCSLQ